MRRSASLVIFCYLLAAFTGLWLARAIDHRGFFELAAGKGDSAAYVGLTRSILDRNYIDPTLPFHRQLSLGTPLLVAGVSLITRLDPMYALPLTCWIAAALCWWLVCRLYDPVTAALALCINIGMIERSLYGGPEAPLLLCCLFALLMWRKGGYPAIAAAAVAMAIAAMLRPSALVFLAGGLLVLLLRRSFQQAGLTAAIVLPLLAGYLWFLRTPNVTVDPVTGYRDFWYSGLPVSFPFWPVARAILHLDEPPTIFLKEFPYILLVLAAVVLALRHFRSLGARLPFDLATFLFSAWFIFSYNSFAAFEEFHRYCLLAIPTSCWLLWQFLNKRYRVPYLAVSGLCICVSLGSALSTEGIRESFDYFRTLIR